MVWITRLGCCSWWLWRDRQGAGGGGECPLCKITDWLHKVVFEKQRWTVESLWVKIRGQASKGSFMVGFYYRGMGSRGGCCLLQLREASCLQALILPEDFNQPGIWWKSGTASCKPCRRLLELVSDIFLIQVKDCLSRGEALLDLLLTNTKELTREVKIGGSLSCSLGPGPSQTWGMWVRQNIKSRPWILVEQTFSFVTN